jgi:hypothetical protein
MRTAIILALGLLAVWGPGAIIWLAALRVSRRIDERWVAVLGEQALWRSEHILGVRAGRLALSWFIAGAIVFFAYFSWMP